MHHQPYTITIEAGRADSQYWKDVWRYRELFFFLSWRDVLVRYKQTAIGVAWSLIRPLVTMVVFVVVFSRLAGLPSGDVPYPLLVYVALLPWQFFANCLGDTGNVLVDNANLLSKVYFPRLLMPVSSVASNMFDFAISLLPLTLLMLWYPRVPGWQIVFLPLFLLLALVASLGTGIWLAALNVQYRDFRYVIPFLVQVGLYVSPIGFASGIIPGKWRLVYSINPIVGIIDGFRWSILGESAPLYFPGVVLSVVVTVGILLSGIRYFCQVERTFADVV